MDYLSAYSSKTEIDEFRKKYFNKNKTCEYELSFPVKKSRFLTTLRKTGDLEGQYVAHVNYIDTLNMSYDDSEIYSSYNDDDDISPVYSSYHSECDYCKEHIQKVKQSYIVGYKIYKKGAFPEKRCKYRKRAFPEKKYKERKRAWTIYQM